jgi:hypothetical protein
MIKQLILLIHFIGLFFYQLIFLADVTVTQDLPTNIAPSSEAIVSITINKSNVTGFAKVQQVLPDGFSAEAVETKGATFSFKDQKMKLIWMALPSEEEFTITYKIKSSESVSGDFTIGGKFSFISESERKNVAIPSATISVSQEVLVDNTPEEPVVEETITEEIVTPEEEVPVEENVENKEVVTGTISTNRTVELIEDGKYKVTVTVNKSNINGFAKITEIVPEGFVAVENESLGGIFSFKDQEAKVLWMALPTSDEFVISYDIESITAANGDYPITGNISYLENDITQRHDMEPTTFNLNVEEPIAVVEEETIEEPENTLQESVEESIEETAVEVVKEEVETPVEEVVVEEKEVVEPVEEITTTPNPETGVSYKVQVAALRTQMATETFSKIFKITKPINIESHEGWSKYIIGSHNAYKAARDERNVIRAKVKRAFVTAYNQGKRITVQEALMISNQKWYK